MSHVPDTLPGQLLEQARLRGQAVALRHKTLGIWQPRTWQDLATETAHLAGALAARGFVSGASLVLLTRPRPEALLLALAAQWLGGVAVVLDPDWPGERLAQIRATLPGDFLFAEDETQLALAQASGGLAHTTIYADGRGLGGQGHLLAYATLLETLANDALPPVSATPAFVFYRIDAAGQLQQQIAQHAELLQAGQHLLATEQLSADEEALASRAFATGAHARYLLAPWLLGGFRINFPENTATRDQDRRELGPTLVAGTRETWERLAALVLTRLPPQGTWHRRWIDSALRTSSRNGPLQLFNHWLLIGPLRDVLGLSRTRVPLLVGEELNAEHTALLAGLGIHVRSWPDPAQWHGLNRADAVEAGSGFWFGQSAIPAA